MNPGVILVGLLGSLVGGRVHASVFPQEDSAPTWPAIRFTVVTEDPFPDQCGSEDTDTDDVRVQLDIVATNYDAMRSLKAAVIAAMAASSTPAERQGGGFDTWDAETRTHRAVVDYVFQPSTPTGSPA